MKITGNSLLTPTNKNISFYNSCIVASEGPNQIAKQNLNILNINYDSVFYAKQTLEPNSVDTPIMYGFLGTDITFLSITPEYDKSNPQNCSGSTYYLEYWFEDQPLIRRTLTDMLVLTGDDAHRIPQVYLNNPSETTVYVNIFAANLDKNTISSNLYPTYNIIDGLSFTSVITDQIYGLNCTGSTQFEILDLNDNVQSVIQISSIDIIKIEDNILTVYTTSDEPLKLKFLSNFNAQQALSKMNWVIEDTKNRYITKVYPALDTTHPTIIYKPFVEPVIMQNKPISYDDLKYRFIDNVIDYDNNNNIRDGIINISNVNVIIVDNLTGLEVSSITYDSKYSITFNVSDVARNNIYDTKQIIVDTAPPIITFNSGITGNMDISADTLTPGIIEKSDIESYFINNIWDDIDGIIKSGITTVISSGTTIYNNITGIGNYNILFTVSDYSLNTTTAQTELTVIDTESPIIYFNFTGNTFTMSINADTSSGTGITENDIINYSISSVTDNYDGNIDINNVIINNVTFPIIMPNIYQLIYNVSDSSNNITTENKTIIVIS